MVAGTDDPEQDPQHRYAAALAWAADHVRLTGPPVARERPWSTVLRLPTADGPVWLKATTPTARAEVRLYRVLAERAPEAVLVPLARDDERGWLLLPDGGPTLRDGAPERVADGVAAAMSVYAGLQRAVAPARAEVLDAGVPDASPAALPERLEEALEATGLDDDVARRRVLVARWATELTHGPAAGLVTVDHQDLHPGNVLAPVPGHGPRFYDWGDAVLAHPFASLLVALGGLARTLGVGPDAPVVLAARDAYLTGLLRPGRPRRARAHRRRRVPGGGRRAGPDLAPGRGRGRAGPPLRRRPAADPGDAGEPVPVRRGVTAVPARA